MNHRHRSSASRFRDYLDKYSRKIKLFFYGCFMIAGINTIIPILAKADPSPSIVISQIPLQLATPTHPKVLIAIGNSQSMDGTLSGAIMVGSGTLSGGLSSLQNSSSPTSYSVPAGFSPPVQAANADGFAPYTVNQSGVLVDNSASRMNLAKAGVKTIIETYMQNTDFALEVYDTSGTGLYSTWVYYMSPDNDNFSFTNSVPNGVPSVSNPCNNYTAASTTLRNNCTALAALYGASTLSSNTRMLIGSSSDDSNINDVLYAGGLPGSFVSYTGPQPATPYPNNYTIANYNAGNVTISYSKTTPNIGQFISGPTNAGFVPYSPQVFYARRGFGYGGSQSSSSGKVIVPMTSVGANPTTATLNVAINKFLPYLKPETNSLSTTEIKSVAGQSPTAGLLSTAKSYLTGLSTEGSCKPSLYVILISDGLPTADLSGGFWPPLGSSAAAGYGVTATFNNDGSLNTTNNNAVTDTINTITDLHNAGVKTFVVGLGAGVDPTVNPQAAATLTAMAVAGGTGNYYPANNSTTLINNLNNILIAVQNNSLSTTAATISSTNLQFGTVEYQASFVSSDKKYQDWTGDFAELQLDPITGFPTGRTNWSAQRLLDLQSNRIITTWNPALNNGLGGGVPFLWDNISTAQQALLQPGDTLGATRLQYLRGTTTQEIRNGGPFRNRTHILGDIVNSQATYVSAPASPYLFSIPSYAAFTRNHATRPSMVYVGANDGMLHAFTADTGLEKFAFIPNAVFANLYHLTAQLYNQNHLFFVDGSPQSGDVQFSDASWHTLLVGGENAGGNSIYALDITNPSFADETVMANSVLWEYTEADLGLTYSQPQIGMINTDREAIKRFAVFFGNGYNSPNNNAVLYAVDPKTGTLIRKINLCASVPGACDITQPEGLSSVALGQIDGLQGQPITSVYAGDLQGNLWAIDVSNADPSQWQARVLFQARDPNGNPQPITTAPLVTLNPSYARFQGLFVMFGTGQLITQNDLSSLQTQTVYGVWDKPALSFILGRTELQAQTLSLIPAATSGLPQDILTDTTNAIGWNSTYGWYNDLPIPGQRIITNPQLINGSFIATLNTPPATPCGVASSMFLDIYYKTGGAYPNVTQLDIDGDGLINSNDQYQGSNPVGIGLLTGYASAPASVGRNKNNNMVQIITMSGGQQVSVINQNNGSRSSSWWQLP